MIAQFRAAIRRSAPHLLADFAGVFALAALTAMLLHLPALI